MTRYKVCSVDKDHYEELNWTITEILEEINRDRSSQWTDFDKSDWKEGWLEFCEGDWYTIPSLIEENKKEFYNGNAK